jgi:hypothetical protein
MSTAPKRRAFPSVRLAVGFGAAILGAAAVTASSHREAPGISKTPKVDGTDFYLFRSYETGRENFVTVVANYQPLQAPYGGPNYFLLDENALYEIHLETSGDAVEDLTFQFRFTNTTRDLAIPVGPSGTPTPIALAALGPVTAGNDANLNVVQTFAVDLVRGDRRTGERFAVTNAANGSATFTKPYDYVGTKTFPDYAAYAAQYVYDVNLPGSAIPGRLFVGQRKDAFVVNLGETFDLVNNNPLGPENGKPDSLADANVTSFVLELPLAFVTQGGGPVVGGWTTASLRQARVLNPKPDAARPAVKDGGAWTQVSRLANPLVNELVVALKDKDRFNASEPKDDAQFLGYVTHPSLPAILEALFGVTAPTAVPREDLVQVFVTGVPGLNVGAGVGEIMRLNTSIAPTAAAQQNRLGVLGGDLAGYPNGRRPGDDTVDISLRAVMGALLPTSVAPAGNLPLTDGAFLDASFVDAAFPYLRTPLPGSPAKALGASAPATAAPEAVGGAK